MNAYTRYVNKAIKQQSRKKQNKQCDQFCKKDYMIQMDSVFRKSAKKYKIPYNPTKKDKQLMYVKKHFATQNAMGMVPVNRKLIKRCVMDFKKNIVKKK